MLGGGDELMVDRPRILAGLVRLTGDFSEAEDCFSDALETALKLWPIQGRPSNPGAWLNVVARRKALDGLRRRSTLQRKLSLPEEEEPGDDRLSLIFTCCHPALSLEAQVALTLRTLGGLSTEEIARAFLVSETTVAQRLVRAQRKIRDAGIPYRMPPPEQWEERLEAVLGVAYLIFNEGYRASHGSQLFRTDLVDKGMELTELLVLLMPGEAEVLGLLALMLFLKSRQQARLSSRGEVVSLEDQDRSQWHRPFIERGVALMQNAMQLGKKGPYQVQAAIASLHSLAPTPEATDWAKICSLYQSLVWMTQNPVVELNLAVAEAMARGPEVGLERLETLHLQDYPPWHAARAELLRRAGRPREAATAYQDYLMREANAPARDFAARRLLTLSESEVYGFGNR